MLAIAHRHCPPRTTATPQEEIRHYRRERKRIQALNFQHDPVYKAAYEFALATKEIEDEERRRAAVGAPGDEVSHHHAVATTRRPCSTSALTPRL